MLQFEDVSYAYDQDRVVSNVTTTFAPGTVYSILGRSGCGKTTLLKLASGLYRPTSGTVSYQGEPLHAPHETFSYMFQRPNLLSWQTVIQNVCLSFNLHGNLSNDVLEEAYTLLRRVGMEHLAHRYPDELSGGQQSRVALCRALLRAPDVLFLDEPFSALDAMTKEHLQDELLTFVREREMTVLLVTHDIEEAIIISDEIRMMEAGQFVYEEENPLRHLDIRRDTELALQQKRALRAILERSDA